MIEAIKKNLLTRSTLYKCIAASLLLHIMVVYFFYKHPVEFYAASFFSKSKPEPTSIFSEDSSSIKSKDDALAETFENFIFLPHSQTKPFDEKDIALHIEALTPQSEANSQALGKDYTIAALELADNESIQSDYFPSTFDGSELAIPIEILTLNEIELQERTAFELTPAHSGSILPLSSDISYIDEPTYQDTYDEVNSNLITQKSPTLESNDVVIAHKNITDIPKIANSTELLYIPNKTSEWVQNELAIEENEQDVLNLDTSATPSLYIDTRNSPLDQEKLIKMSNIVSWNDSFDINVSISSPVDKKGYIFSININPKQHIAYEKIQQNFYFLIDSSHTVDKHKFSLYKRAITKALSSLKEGDKFNIIVLDKKLTRFSNKTSIYSIRSQQLAEDFIEKVSQTNIINSANLLESLEKASHLILDNEEMHTAILLTSGQVNQGIKNQQKSLTNFIEKKGNKFSLYAAAVGNKNNLVTLDMLCNLSGGNLIYSDTNASFPRKLATMVKDLRYPIAKDVKVSAISSNPKAELKLVANQNHLPPFFANQPYTIVGNIERLSDINLTIEAKHADEWVCIDKKISFNDARVDDRLIKVWNKAQVAAEYQRFLKEAKSNHLKKAKEILQETYGRSVLE